MIVLGIDPGLTNTGWGVIERSGSRTSCVAYGCVTTDPTDSVPRRLKAVRDQVATVIEMHGPGECAIETLFFNANVRTAFATGQARGAAMLAAADAGLEVGEYGPSEVKLAVVGTGSADKRQVQYMVKAILGLAEEPHPDHAADALAIAICHANLCGDGGRGAATSAASGVAEAGGSGWDAAVARAQARETRRRTGAGR